MNNIDRAKQFLPFDALKGLKEELRKKEENLLYQPKRIISEEKSAKINLLLLTLSKEQNYLVEYYSCGKYLKEIGKIKIINNVKQIKILDKIINFEDIYDIEKI